MKKLTTEKILKTLQEDNNGDQPLKNNTQGRISVQKTYKLYIGGHFPRTESGRYIAVTRADGVMVNVCRSSRKDFRNAVVVARQAFLGWSQKSAYNRSQILYRLAEMLEGRKEQFIRDLINIGIPEPDAVRDVDKAIDVVVHYAGWCDKYVQIFSSVNPVSTSHFNFSVPEPMGVVGLVMGDLTTLSQLIGQLLPILVSGNTTVILVDPTAVFFAMNLAEVVATSDIPAGVINILSGLREELLFQFGSHLDLNAVVSAALPEGEVTQLREWGAAHILRVVRRDMENLSASGAYSILDTCEIKTTWHPIGQ